MTRELTRRDLARATGSAALGSLMRTVAALEPAADGLVYDSDRIMFLRNYLTQLQRATAEGVPVRGYFHWSSMDNFEWSAGYGTRFGLIYVDYGTLKRTPKLSASFFREVASRNYVV